MIDLDRLAVEYGLDLSDTPLPPARPPLPPLTAVGEHLCADLLRRIELARIALEIVEGVVRHSPNNDAAFDGADASFSRSLEAAREAFQRFRERRECEGTA